MFLVQSSRRIICLRSRIIAARFPSYSTASGQDPQIQREVLETLNKSETFRKISQNPAALSAFQKLAETIQNSGHEVGTKPSPLQMLKMAANSDIINASKSVIQEFKNAGVDLGSKDVVDELQSIAQKIYTTPKS